MNVSSVENAEDLKNLLIEWNLAHHYKHFLEQKVTLDVFSILKPTHVDKLFQNRPVGDQAVFEHNLELWKQNRMFSFKNNTKAAIKTKNPKEIKEKPNILQMPDEHEFRTTAVIVPQISVAPSLQISSASRRNMDQAKTESAHTSTPPVTATKPTSSPTIPKASLIPKHLAMALVPVRYNLRAILEETSGGQMIMAYYEKHKILREEHRTALINVIARYIDANGGVLSLSESNQIEQQIVELFPTEKSEFYRTNRRGRIYNKVANMKRVYKKFHLTDDATNPSMDNSSASAYSTPSSPVEIIKEEDNDEYDDYTIREFRSSSHAPEKYIQFWKSTQKLRLKHIEDIESLTQILEKWPEYKQHNAVEYIHMDFKAKYPDATSFSEVFHQNKVKFQKMLYSKIAACSAGYKYLQQYQKCSAESQDLIILVVMHQLFPPNQKVIVDEMGNKRKKRYSIQCSQNAFVCIRSTLSSLESALHTQLVTGTPPMVLIVGELGGDIDQIFVYFEGVRFPMDSIIAAAELVCELFFLFDLDYPEEAVLFYYFLQTFFLNIESEMKNTKIYTVINEINAS